MNILILVKAVNQPKGTKNESNSQLERERRIFGAAVNQPKGTKNESNSQQDAGLNPALLCCKSTQRYKERKQFTTPNTRLYDAVPL